MRFLIRFFLLIFCCIGYSACNSFTRYADEPQFEDILQSDSSKTGSKKNLFKKAPYSQRFIWKVRYLAQSMADSMTKRYGKKFRYDKNNKLILTTITPLDDIEQGTSIGRLITEQLTTEMDNAGFHIIDPKKSDGLYIKDEVGEFALSRKKGRYRSSHDVNMLLVGSYSFSGTYMIINVRVLDMLRGDVLSSVSTNMNLEGDRYLLDMIFNSYDDDSIYISGRLAEDISLREFKDDVDRGGYDILDANIKKMIYDLYIAGKSRYGRLKNVVISSFVSFDSSMMTSSLGRVVTEKVINEIGKYNITVLDIVDSRIEPVVRFSNDKRFSDKIKGKSVDAILYGGYKTTPEGLIVSSRLKLVDSDKVLSSSDFFIDIADSKKLIEFLKKDEADIVDPF